jgi:hypothetical protein
MFSLGGMFNPLLIPKKANYTFSVYDEVSQTGTKKNFDGCYWSFFRKSALP